MALFPDADTEPLHGMRADASSRPHGKRHVHDGAARSRVLWLACVAHALHDGYTDMLYVLLPVWKAEFGLAFGAVALLRGLYAGAMALLQLPAGRLSRRIGPRATLTFGTMLAAAGYAVSGFTGSLIGLCLALVMSGTGSSTQHPISSAAVTRAFAPHARGPLGVYNFAGDLGKAALPAAMSLLVTAMPWRHALWTISLVGFLVAASIGLLLPRQRKNAVATAKPSAASPGAPRRGFPLLLAIGILDSAVRMGLLTFLPFLLKAKGASIAETGTALALVFIGGAAGKFACGWLGARIGVIGTVLATEAATGALMIGVLFVPLTTVWLLLPLLGVMLNGTSSVLYGTVPELTTPERTERAFALFYSGTIGSGALSPVLYGVLGDHIGVRGATWSAALTALVILPLALRLGPQLARR